MNIAQAKAQVKDTVEAYFATDETGRPFVDVAHQRPLLLLGAPGIGKTAIVAQVAAELGVGLVSYSMTHHTRQSALGLPVITHKTFDEVEYDVSEYTMSEIIASVYDCMETGGVRRGILFLDEINCVSETLHPSMLQFLQFKTFGKHRIPTGWVVVCAGNPPEYNRSVHDFDIVTLDRLRRITIEPDFTAWRSYALDKGMHPAVLSFLDVKNDCFYSVESTPSGKSFVTARGWDDLSDVMKLFEHLGKPVDAELISQFIQNDDIAERFALYYELFRTYRSDYRIEDILDGACDDAILERARGAAFDERLAVLGLLIDGVSQRLESVLVRQEALAQVRDTLRGVRTALEGGAALAESFDVEVARRVRELADQLGSGVTSTAASKPTALANSLLKELRGECTMARTLGGAKAFQSLHLAYRGQVGMFEVGLREASAALERCFDFVEQAFGADREMLVFVTELTARRICVQFISAFGCDRYFQNNGRLMVDDRRGDLLARLQQIEEEPAQEERAADAAQAAGADAGIDEYYRHAPFEYGFASLCNMTLPTGLQGKRVLDVGCRRGKGVFKLSDRVGATGHAIGIDWEPSYIAEANERMERAWRKSGLPANNMEFHVAYPEDLMAAGLGDGTVDFIFINSVINLTYDPRRVLAELFRVLAPGGMVVCETVLADAPRDAAVVKAARALGNSIQAAPAVGEFEAAVAEAGFMAPNYFNQALISPKTGYKFTHEVEIAPSDEVVSFTAQVAELCKARK